MKAALRALMLALEAMATPAVRRLLVRSALIGLAGILVLLVGLAVGLPPLIAAIPDTGFDWLDRAIDQGAGIGLPFVAVLVVWWVFPALMMAITGIFVEEVIASEERRRWPDRPAVRRPSVIGELARAVLLGLRMLAVHLALLPVYLMLLFTGVGPVLLYLAVNGWFLGREFFETVALRHHPLERVRRLERRWRPAILAGGLVIGLVGMFPPLNLLASVFAAALMTHLYHLLSREAEERA